MKVYQVGLINYKTNDEKLTYYVCDHIEYIINNIRNDYTLNEYDITNIYMLSEQHEVVVDGRSYM